jgi:hypothetical protein
VWVDLAITGVVIPIFTYIAWSTHSKPSPLYDWQYDRLFKREANYRSKHIKPNTYLLTANKLLTNTSTDIKEIAKTLNYLSLIQNCIGDNQRLRDEMLTESFIECVLKLVTLRTKVEELKSSSLLLTLYSLEESAAYLFLILSLSSNELYKKYEGKIDETMKLLGRDKEPYTLRNALVDSYFFNKRSKGIVYDGQVIPMNPERMKDYDTDIIFIHGQQSHCFNTWRVLRQNTASVRTFKLSTIWPPKFLTKKYNSRILTLRYNVHLLLTYSLHNDR